MSKCSLNRDNLADWIRLADGLIDACFRYLIVFVMASLPSCLPVPVAITKIYAECHFWFLELTDYLYQILGMHMVMPSANYRLTFYRNISCCLRLESM